MNYFAQAQRTDSYNSHRATTTPCILRWGGSIRLNLITRSENYRSKQWGLTRTDCPAMMARCWKSKARTAGNANWNGLGRCRFNRRWT